MQDVTHWARDICGVYLLYQDDKVAYVGKSTHVPKRVRQHAKAGDIQFNKVMVAYCLKEELWTLEHRMINQYNPEQKQAGKREVYIIPSPEVNLSTGVKLTPKSLLQK